jgi:hypothetical protein
MRIKRELKTRSLSDYDINNAIKTIEADAYLEKIYTLSDKRWQQLNGYSTQIKKTKAISIPLLSRLGNRFNLSANQST